MGFDELYQEIILDHYRHPRNAAPAAEIDEELTHENPTCGDSIRLKLLLDDSGTVSAVRFFARGCAVSVASASMMSERLTGRSAADAQADIDLFVRTLRGELPATGLEALGDLAALEGIVKFPLRVKCATLAWHAASDALVSEKRRLSS